jgi:hypothetical protein
MSFACMFSIVMVTRIAMITLDKSVCVFHFVIAMTIHGFPHGSTLCPVKDNEHNLYNKSRKHYEYFIVCLIVQNR